jgi:hypothetical protein
MAISNKTRKLLWGRSGNRCAICRRELVMDATATDNESIVGDECHIVAKNPGGPRSDSVMPDEDINCCSNLILLCKVHHKMVDDQPSTYTADKLRELKRKHELWVRKTLGATGDSEGNLHIAPRVSTGKEILSIVINADAHDFSYDELMNEED